MSNESIYPTENTVEDDTRFYVYAYLDPITLVPFYIGKGKSGRADAHLRDAKNKSNTDETYYNTFKLRKIRKILESGLEPIIEYVCTDMTEEDAFELEIFLIQEIGRKVLREGPLTNLTEGGEGISGCVRDKNFYHLVHIESGEEQHATQSQMHTKLGITQAGACYLVSGKLQVSGGWRLFSNTDTRTSFVGQKHKFVNAYTKEEVYCTQNELIIQYGLSAAPVSMLVSGIYTQTKGWCLNTIPDDFVYEDSNTYKFIHYEGEERFLTIQEFKDSIDPSSKVLELIKGTRNHVRGWGLNDKPSVNRVNGADPKTYTFFNFISNEEFIGSRKEFQDYSGELSNAITKMITNGGISINKWTVINDPTDYTKNLTRGKKKGDPTIFNFYNDSDRESFKGTKREFKEKYPNKNFKFERMIENKRSFGWIMELID